MKKIFFVLFFCSNYFFGQYTLIPDPVFEQNLVNQQIDSDGIINGQVLTSDIAARTQLSLSSTNGGFNSVTNLQGIEGFSALQKLWLTGNDSLYNVNITNMNLKELYFDNFGVQNIYVSAPLLELLQIINTVPLLETLDVTNCPMLKNLYCSDNSLHILEVSNNPALETLIVYNNQLTELTIGNNPNLNYISCFNNHIASLNVTSCPQLKNLNAKTNNLTNLNVSQNTVLQTLSCNNNNITSLNLQNNHQLKILWCQANNLTELNVQNGSNSLLNGTVTYGTTTYSRFIAINNPNLHCILVDDVANCQTNWVGVDPASNFVASQAACDNLLSNQSFIANELEVYPNPVSDILTINNHNFDILNISIYNLLGEKILVQETNKNQIDVSKLASGAYMVSIVADNKKSIKKIMKN
jgi:Leucine-rich repeat (LRR) protein